MLTQLTIWEREQTRQEMHRSGNPSLIPYHALIVITISERTCLITTCLIPQPC